MGSFFKSETPVQDKPDDCPADKKANGSDGNRLLKLNKLNWFARSGDVPAIVAICALVLIVFAKTIFRGVSISRFYLVTHWDSLLSQFRCGIPMQVDPSAQLESIPNYTQAANLFHAGGFPLWNHLNTFGAPLIADMQATVLSPLRLVFDIWPNNYTYNLQLITQVLVCAIGTYFLARLMGALRLPSVLAACAFAFCPFMLWNLELQSGVGYVLYPLVLWLMGRAGRNRRVSDAIWAGIGCGATILTGHPEPSFFAGMFGTILMAMLCVPAAGYRTFFLLLGVAAMTAFCIDAPVLLPFVEFLRNGDCYKFGVTESLSLSWQAVAYNLLAPGAAGASPYLGVLAVSFVPVAFGGKQLRAAMQMSALAVLALIPAVNFFPFSLLCKVPPFSYLITVYFLPLLLLSLSVLAALGLSRLSEWAEAGRGAWRLDAVVAVLLLAVTVPFTLHFLYVPLNACNFDLTLPDSSFNLAAWRRDAIIAAIFACSVMLASGFLKRIPGWSVAMLALILNFISVGAIAKSTLVPQPNFELPNIAATRFLSDSGERVMSTGKHILKPNLNVIWGIDNVTSSNVMWPKRYLKFITACGASADQYTQAFTHDVSTLIDLGSVRYVLSQAPVICPQDPAHQVKPFTALTGPALLVPGLHIDNGGVWRSSVDAGAGGSLHLSGAEVNARSKLQLVLELRNKHDLVIWFSDRLPLEKVVAFTLPLAQDATSEYRLSARVYNADNGTFTTLAGNQDSLQLTTLPEPEAGAVAHFKFIKDLPGTDIRLYENTGSLPRAYLAFADRIVSGEPAAFSAITNPGFDPHQCVIVEDAKEAQSQNNPATVPEKIKQAQLIMRKADEVQIQYESKRNGWLVLTDTFYPGWKAFIDGHPVPVFRANYLFRAIQAPSGKHMVTYRYQPILFYIGAAMFVSFWLMVAIAAGAMSLWNRSRSVPSN
jgi:Bacterial membrane protein YfhO